MQIFQQYVFHSVESDALERLRVERSDKHNVLRLSRTPRQQSLQTKAPECLKLPNCREHLWGAEERLAGTGLFTKQTATVIQAVTINMGNADFKQTLVPGTCFEEAFTKQVFILSSRRLCVESGDYRSADSP